MADFVVGDIGATVDVQVIERGAVVDLSAVGGKSLVMKKPDGTHTTWTAAFKTDGTDGYLRFTTALVSDLDQSGDWQGQVYLTGLGSWTGRSITTFSFNVRAQL